MFYKGQKVLVNKEIFIDKFMENFPTMSRGALSRITEDFFNYVVDKSKYFIVKEDENELLTSILVEPVWIDEDEKEGSFNLLKEVLIPFKEDLTFIDIKYFLQT